MANQSSRTTEPLSPTTAPAKLNVLLVGGGGREHAIATRLVESPRLGSLWVTHPDNPGLAALGKPVDVPVNIREFYRLEQFCEKHQIHLAVIGPEEPLAEGFADKLRAIGVTVFGPSAAAAQLEADKAWAKQLMRSAAIPTAEARIFTDAEQARAYLESRVRDDKLLTTLLGPPQDLRGEEKRRFIIDKLRANLTRIAGAGDAASIAEARARAAIGAAVAAAETFRDPTDRRAFMNELVRTEPAIAAARTTRIDGLPVIKAAGLAKGKGVIVPSTLAEGLDAIEQIMVKRIFGDAGRQLIVEERLSGPEASLLAIVDGRNILPLPPCQDHKRLGDGDTGPNTGGMGAFCPTSLVDDATMARVEREVLVPTVDAMRREGIEYRGVLFAGLMLTHGGPKVLEFNCRFGDPECQPLMMRLKSDVIELFLAACAGTLDQIDVEWDPRVACCVVLAAGGYPEKPRAGAVITGIDEASRIPDVRVFHAGTKRDAEGRIVTAGGRVLGVTALGATLEDARAAAYRACDLIQFEGKTMRRDIGLVRRDRG